MNRKNFINSACKIGLCSCVGMPLLSSDIFASNDDEKKQEDWRIGFMQKRFAKLWEVVKQNVSEEDKEKIIEGLGRACAQDGKERYSKFIGDVDAWLEALKSSWIEKVDYDKEKGIVKIYGKKTGKCFCPFVDSSLITKDFCNCSLGNTKETWAIITGKPVDASILESVLYGSDRCSFQIKIG